MLYVHVRTRPCARLIVFAPVAPLMLHPANNGDGKTHSFRTSTSGYASATISHPLLIARNDETHMRARCRTETDVCAAKPRPQIARARYRYALFSSHGTKP